MEEVFIKYWISERRGLGDTRRRGGPHPRVEALTPVTRIWFPAKND